MKKALSMILVLTMVLALTLPAMAAETDITPSDGKTKDVTATYKGPEDISTGKIYLATITWNPVEGSNLTYTGAKTSYKWDTGAMKYMPNEAGNVAAKWEGFLSYTVKVENFSNDALSFKAAVGENKYAMQVEITAGGTTSARNDATVTVADPTNGSTNYAADTKYEKTSQEMTFKYSPVTGTSTNVTSDAETVVIDTITVTITHN